MKAITPVTAGPSHPTLDDLRRELDDARHELREAEMELAQEQAAVNAFRMHCRLKLDAWINILLELQAQKQSLLTQWQLTQNGENEDAPNTPNPESKIENPKSEDPFWQGTAAESEPPAPVPDLLLPTDTPGDKAAEKRLYRELARRFHPDLGRTAVDIAYRTEMMAAVNNAYTAGDAQALYDLAGELDPQDVAGLALMETAEMRRLRQEILKTRGRQRRAKAQLVALRQENTTRLWQKARLLAEGEADWWELVRREIERAIERLRWEVTQLQERLTVPTPDTPSP
jgi:hypothetical protein